MLAGEAGIGKSALLEHAQAEAEAEAAGLRVVHARGMQSESDIPFAGPPSSSPPARPARRHPNTIEYHLGQIYRKLEVRGRSQLARLMAMELPEEERPGARSLVAEA